MAKKLTFVILTAVVLVALVGCLPKINQPPVVTEVTAPATVLENSSFEVSAKASDPEGAAVTVQFTFGSVTKDGVLDGGVYKATFTAPDVSSDQDITLTVIAYDDKGKASTPKTKTITVIANKAPSIVSLEAPSSVDEEKTFTATATVSDPNGLEDLDRVVFTFGGNEFVVTSHTDGVFVGSITAPAVDENQTFVLSAKAYDKDGNESAPVTRNVQVINLTKPVVTAVKALGTTFREGQEITVRATVTSSHPMNTTVTITVDGVPKTATRKVTGATSVYEATFTLALVDEDTDIEISAQAFDDVNDQYSELAYDYITIENNEPPSVEITLPDSVEEDYLFTVNVSISDPEGDAVVATVTYNGQSKAITDSATFIAEEVDADSVGVVTVEYTDQYTPAPAGGTEEATFLILNDEDVPTVVATAATSLYGGETLTVEWNATDSDGIATVEITFDGIDLDPATGLEASGSEDFVIPATFEGTFTIYVKATEAGVAVNPDTGEWTQIVTVLANDVPVVNATPLEFTLDEGSTFTITVTATDTIGGLDKVEITGDALAAPVTVDLGGAATASQVVTLTATSFEDAASKILTFAVKATDVYGLESAETIGTATINDVNTPPTVDATVAAEVIGGTTFTVEWDATDTDGISAVDLSFEGVTITSYSATEAAGSYEFTAPDVSVDTPATLVVKVTDGKTVNPAETTKEYSFTVKANAAPEATVVISATAVYDNEKFNLTVTATDDYEIAKITFSGEVLATTTEVVVNAATTTQSATLDPVDVVDATAVTNYLIVTVEDVYGKTWTQQYLTTVRDYNATPTVTATVSVVNVVEGDSFTVEWAATDTDGIAVVEISFAGITLDTATSALAEGSMTFTAPEVSGADTLATVTVKAYDGKLYNQKSDSAQDTLTVKNRPDISITGPSTGLEDGYVDFVVNISDDDTVTNANITAYLADDTGAEVTPDSSSFDTGTNTRVATFTFHLPFYPDTADHSATITIVATDSDGDIAASGTANTSFTIENNPGAPSVVFDTIELWNNDVSLKRADWPEEAPIDGLHYYLRIKMNADQTNVTTITYYFVDVTNPATSSAAASATVGDTNGDLEVDTYEQVFFTNDIPAGAYYVVAEGQRPGKATKYATATLADGSKYAVVLFDKNTPVTLSDSTITGVDAVFNTTPVIESTNNVFVATFTGVTKEPTFKLGSTAVSGALTPAGTLVNGYYVGQTTLVATIDTTAHALADDNYALSLTAYYDIPGEVTGKATPFGGSTTPTNVIVDNNPPDVGILAVNNMQTTATVTYKVIDVTFGSGEIGLLDLTSLSTQSAVLTTSAGTKVTFTLTGNADARTATVTLIATDVLGRAASVEYPFTADTKFATLSLDDFYANTHTINKDVTIEDLSTVTNATVSVASAYGNATATIDTSGNLHIEVSTDTTLTINVTATDHFGNENSITAYATVDTVAPAITATPNSNVAGPNDYLVAVNVTEGPNVDTFATLTFTATDPAMGTYPDVAVAAKDATLNEASLTGVVTADRRTLTIDIRAEDFAGNDVTKSATVEFDNAIGSFAFVSAATAADGQISTDTTSIITDATQIIVNVKITDLSTVSQVASSITPPGANNATITAATWTGATNVTFTATIELASPQDYALTLVATDSVGNDATYVIKITKDDGDPKASITDVATTGTVVATITATDLSMSDINAVLDVAGTLYYPAETLSPASSVATTLHFDVTTDVAPATLTLTATDVLGQATVATWSGYIDTKVGTFAWQTDPNTAQPEVDIASSNSGITFTLDATDLAGPLASMTAVSNNIAVTPEVTYTDTGIATLTVTFESTQSQSVTITLTATDANNNVATQTWSFTADTKAPTLSEVLIGSNGDKVWITFDEEIVLQTPATVTAKVGGTIVGVVTDVTQLDAYTIRADFSGVVDFQGTNTYTIVVAADSVKDLLGNANLEISTTTAATSILAPSR